MKQVSAFCPSGISSFFQPVISRSPITKMEEALRIGARGGGFILEKGVHTKVRVTQAKRNSIKITINGKKAPEAKVTRKICSLLLERVDTSYMVSVDHDIEVPIGAGYGTSAAGAVSTALALSKAVGLRLTLNKLAQFAHTAEIFCATGLGSVSGVIRGGAILILEPGAPGYDQVDWMPLEPSHQIVTASFAPIPKENIIFSPRTLAAVNQETEQVLQQVLYEPDIALFLKLCNNFAQKAGFLSDRVKTCIDVTLKAGAIGATQNMIGDAFHALVDSKDIDQILTALKGQLSREQIIVS